MKIGFYFFNLKELDAKVADIGRLPERLLKDPKDILAQPVTHISIFQDIERSWSTEISLTDLARISIPSF